MTKQRLRLEAATVDLETGAYTCGGVGGQLSPSALRLLAYMSARPMQTLSRAELLASVWGYDASTLTRTVDTTIRRLRAVLEPDTPEPRHLVTARGAGYRFVPLAPQAAEEVPLVLGACTIWLGRLQARWADGRSVTLSAQEGALLRALHDRGGALVSRATLLREVWHDRSGRSSRAVDNAIVRLRAKLEVDPAHPRFLKTVRGAGYQLLVGPAVTRTEPLPVDPTPLRGREAALSELSALLASPGLITVLGPGGIGKTRLARAVLRQQESAFFCDLADAVDLGGLLRSVAGGLGISALPPGSDAQIAELASQLGGLGDAVVVFDNLEQVAAVAASALPRLLARAPALRLLATSRLRLRLRGERVYPLSALGPGAAAALFTDRYAAVGGRISARDAEDVAALVVRLEGMPLAIELAAGRGRLMRPAALLSRLDRQLALLRGGTTPRHASLEAAIAWSWELLTSEQQRVLAACSVFSGGFSLEAAEDIVGEDALEHLEALLDHSLLRSASPPTLPGAIRFSMLESIKAFARAKLSPEEAESVADQHAACFARISAVLLEDRLLQGATETARQLQLERGNLQAAVAHSLSRAPSDAAWCVCALSEYLNAIGEHVVLHRWIAALQPQVPPLLGALLGRLRGVVDLGVGQTAPALAALESALALAEASGSGLVVAQILGTLGTARDLNREPEAARAAYLAGAARAGAEGAFGLQAMLQVYAGVMETTLGDADAADALYRAAVSAIGDVGFFRERGFVFSQLGVMAMERGAYGQCLHFLRQALPAQELTDSPGDIGMTRAALGMALLGDGQRDAAIATIEEMMPISSRGLNQMRAAFVHAIVGQFFVMVGDFDRAEPLLRRSAEIPGPVRFQGLAWLSVCDAAAGRAEEARRVLAESADAIRFPYTEPQLQSVFLAWHGILLAGTTEARAASVAHAHEILRSVRELRIAGGPLLAASSYDFRAVIRCVEQAAEGQG